MSTFDKQGAWIQGGGAKAWLNDLRVIVGMQSILICVQGNAPVVMHLQEFTFTDIVTDSEGPSQLCDCKCECECRATELTATQGPDDVSIGVGPSASASAGLVSVVMHTYFGALQSGALFSETAESYTGFHTAALAAKAPAKPFALRSILRRRDVHTHLL